MNCTNIREQLPGLLYNELTSNESKLVKEHLAQCPSCRGEFASFKELQNMLECISAPAVTVSVPAIFRKTADIEARRARRWRRAAYSLAGLAAAVLVVLIFRLEIRFRSGQVVLSWRGTSSIGETQPSPKVELSTSNPPGPSYPAVSEAELQPLRGLIYALDSGLDQLSQDVDARDRRQQQQIAQLQEQVTQLRVAFQRQMAIYLADSSRKGENR